LGVIVAQYSGFDGQPVLKERSNCTKKGDLLTETKKREELKMLWRNGNEPIRFTPKP
jgi:hypothetical protein